jgi:Ca2+-binding RTX toxin-like protein
VARRGTDTQNGGDGDDVLHSLARDRQVDTIDCGAGNDVLWLNAKETTDVYVNCETVKSVTVHGDGDDS